MVSPPRLELALLAALASLLPWALSHALPNLAFFFLFFLPLPLFLLGLSYGWKNLAVASAFHILLLGLFGQIASAFFSSFTWAFPTLLITFQALRSKKQGKKVFWYPSPRITFQVLAYTTALTLGLSLYFFNSQELLAENLRLASLQNLSGVLRSLSFDEAQKMQELLEGVIQLLILWGPGFFGSAVFLSLACMGMLAQKILLRQGKALRKNFSFFPLHRFLVFPLGVAFCMAFFFSDTISVFGKNLLLLFSTPYFLLGLHLIHAYARSLKRGAGTALLFALYILLAYVPWLVCGIALGGLFGGFFAQKFTGQKHA